MGSGVSKPKRPSSAHPSGPDSAAGKASTALGNTLAAAGVKKVVLIRHANAKPRDPEAAAIEAGAVLKPDTPFANAWTVGDLTRELQPKGEEQAVAARAWFDTFSVRAVIVSEATRAIKTKDIMTSDRFPAGGPGCMTLHTLHPARSGTPKCEKMFDKLGYGTLNTYYADTSVEGCEGQGKVVFREYMDKVTQELHELIGAGKANFPAKGDTIAVFGHAVFLNAVAVSVAEAMGITDAEAAVAKLELGEAQGILCDAVAMGVSMCGA